jgi:deoxycytidylate deaminase
MKSKHIAIRIEQCLALAKASNCPRRKFGALLLDPVRNVILADGYNGGPRGGEALCGGGLCLRDGFQRENVEIVKGSRQQYQPSGGSIQVPEIQVRMKDSGERLQAFTVDPLVEKLGGPTATEQAEAWVDEMVQKHPPIESGTQIEIGCHHAEMNVICNAAANGIPCRGAWIIVIGEPCLLCSKLIHHAGIERVLCVKGGYVGGQAGPEYLRKHGVEVEYVDGPVDPRSISQ